MHITASSYHAGLCAYSMLQAGGREEMLSMWFHAVGIGVSYTSGLD